MIQLSAFNPVKPVGFKYLSERFGMGLALYESSVSVSIYSCVDGELSQREDATERKDVLAVSLQPLNIEEPSVGMV